MSTTAPDRSARTRFESSRLHLQDRLVEAVADESDRANETSAVDSAGVAGLAHDYVLRDSGSAAYALPADAVFARVVAAWEPNDAVTARTQRAD